MTQTQGRPQSNSITHRTNQGTSYAMTQRVPQVTVQRASQTIAQRAPQTTAPKASQTISQGAAQTGYDTQEYIYGSAVLAPLWHPGMEDAPKHLSTRVRKNREKANFYTLGYVAFLLLSILLMVGAFINYIELRADLTNRISDVASLQESVNRLERENEENYNQIIRDVNYQAIEHQAITQLGMMYPQQDQIVTYENEGTDYFRSISASSQIGAP
ncbi:MAG: hypothetical protein LBM69_08630 [Lachnospiraceae bacterium]|jgi:hypothetical protein|nr:hypothetical protein [Lachnospiraceae bacterium]